MGNQGCFTRYLLDIAQHVSQRHRARRSRKLKYLSTSSWPLLLDGLNSLALVLPAVAQHVPPPEESLQAKHLRYVQ